MKKKKRERCYLGLPFWNILCFGFCFVLCSGGGFLGRLDEVEGKVLLPQAELRPLLLDQRLLQLVVRCVVNKK